MCTHTQHNSSISNPEKQFSKINQECEGVFNSLKYTCKGNALYLKVLFFFCVAGDKRDLTQIDTAGKYN